MTSDQLRDVLARIQRRRLTAAAIKISDFIDRRRGRPNEQLGKRIFDALTGSSRGKHHVGIYVVHLAFGEQEKTDSLNSVLAQKDATFCLQKVADLPKQLGHQTVSKLFESAPSNYLLVKIDGDMVLQDQFVFRDILKFFNSQTTYRVLQLAIRDHFTGGWMQGVNVFSARSGPPLMGVDPVRTDKTSVSAEERYVSFEWSDRIGHCPNPSMEQALHFGAHRAAKIVNSRGKDYSNVHYMRRVASGLSLHAPHVSDETVRGAMEWFTGGNHDPKILDYRSEEWEDFAKKARLSTWSHADLHTALNSYGQQKIQPAYSGKVRFSWALLLPHLKQYGGVQRLLYLARKLIELGDDVEILVPEKSGIDSAIETSFHDVMPLVKNLNPSVATERIRDFVVCGDASTALIQNMREVRARRYISLVLAFGGKLGVNHVKAQLTNPSDLVVAVSKSISQGFPLPSLLIPGAVDTELFKPPRSKRRGTKSGASLVAHWGRGRSFKGGKDVIEFTELVRNFRPDVRLTVFSAEPITESIPDYVNAQIGLTRNEVAALMASSDGLVSFEHRPGWSNQQAEMAATGGLIFGNGMGSDDFLTSYPKAYPISKGETMDSYAARVAEYMDRDFLGEAAEQRNVTASAMSHFSWQSWTKQLRRFATELLAFPLDDISDLRTKNFRKAGSQVDGHRLP